MSIKQFIRCSPSRKVSIVTDDPNPDYIYEYLSDRLGIPIEDITSKYTILIHSIRGRIFIKGSYQDIAVIFYKMNKFGLQYESIQQSELRIDINQFFNKLR
jgi:hypothetical protein